MYKLRLLEIVAPPWVDTFARTLALGTITILAHPSLAERSLISALP